MWNIGWTRRKQNWWPGHCKPNSVMGDQDVRYARRRRLNTAPAVRQSRTTVAAICGTSSRSHMFLTHAICGRAVGPMQVTVTDMRGSECAVVTTLQPRSGNHKLAYQLYHGGRSCSVTFVLFHSYNKPHYQR
jgi:hypothetical protein